MAAGGVCNSSADCCYATDCHNNICQNGANPAGISGGCSVHNQSCKEDSDCCIETQGHTVGNCRNNGSCG